MRESILTIPVNEVFEPRCGCPICAMRNTVEEHICEYIMGAAMMEPDVRMIVKTVSSIWFIPQSTLLHTKQVCSISADFFAFAFFEKNKPFFSKIVEKKQKIL